MWANIHSFENGHGSSSHKGRNSIGISSYFVHLRMEMEMENFSEALVFVYWHTRAGQCTLLISVVSSRQVFWIQKMQEMCYSETLVSELQHLTVSQPINVVWIFTAWRSENMQTMNIFKASSHRHVKRFVTTLLSIAEHAIRLQQILLSSLVRWGFPRKYFIQLYIIFSSLEDEEYKLTEMKNLCTRPLFYTLPDNKAGVNKKWYSHQN